MKQQVAKLNYLHIAPRKVRLVANTLKGLSAQEAEAQLLLRPQRSSKPLLKLLRSAIANAKQNHKLDPDKLIVGRIFVDQGPMLKRFLPRAMGRATPIQKKMSHVTIVLHESKGRAERFIIQLPEKKKKDAPNKTEKKIQKKEDHDEPQKKATDAPRKAEPVKGKGDGVLRKMFRRKTI
ncbi:MAG: 50S ribosomal protein L22 [Patescibacteria group bacterium]